MFVLPMLEVKKHCRFGGNGIVAAVLKCGFCCCVVALFSGCLLSERIEDVEILDDLEITVGGVVLCLC